jgi:NitT/TauT family transport system permease protein
MKNKTSNYIPPIISIIVLIVIWWTISYLHFWPDWLFPTPQDVFSTLVKGFLNQTFILGILTSLKRLFIGFGFSLLIGTILGFSLAKIKLIKSSVGFIILGLQTLPSICWLPLALLWFGLNEKAIIFVIIIGSILSVTISVEAAISNIPPQLINAGKMLGAQNFDLYRFIIMPAILPPYFTGIKQSWSFAWRSLMSGEMLFVTSGLGQLLMFGRELNDMSQVMAIMIVIVAIGTIFDQLIFGRIEQKLKDIWGFSAKI